MSDKIVFNNFCWNKQCPQYIEWEVDVGDSVGNPQVYIATSCQKVGQSYEIYEYPEDCIHLKEIKEFKDEWEKNLIWERLTPWKKATTF